MTPISRRLFSLSLLPLAALPAIAATLHFRPKPESWYPKTIEEAISAGWKLWSPDGKQTKFPIYSASGKLTGTAFCSYISGDRRVNFEVPA